MTRAQVHIYDDFAADAARHGEWLVGEGRLDWIEELARAIDEVIGQLADFPQSGEAIARSDRIVVRQILFRRLPYVAWYGHGPREPVEDVHLLRLFGRRQRRPNPAESASAFNI